MKKQFSSAVIKRLAWCIARVRINRVTHETIEGRGFILKERNLFSWILIALGNCVFRFRSAPVRVLHQRQWQQWEEAIHAALGAEVPSQVARGLLLPKISGKPLCDVVGADGKMMSIDDVIDRLRLALEALYRLHQIEIVVDGRSVLVSHGDASVTNVIISDDKNSATWLDFDLRHDLRKPAPIRHADDLRAFMISSTMCLAVEEATDEIVKRFAQVSEEAYPKQEIWQRWSEDSGFGAAIDVFSMAQRFRGTIAYWRCLNKYR